MHRPSQRFSPSRKGSPGTSAKRALKILTGLCIVAVGAGACTPEMPEPEPQPVFPSTNRPEVRGNEMAVSSDHPLASAVGMDVLRNGGNAVDAVIAMAGVLAVVRPHMNGVGGDAFGLFYDAATGDIHALNGSGRAGARATPEFWTSQGLSELPEAGATSVSVPGAVSAWEVALDRFGSRDLAELLGPAIEYAEAGFPVTSRLASDFEAQGGALNEPGRALYLPRDGEAPEVGSLLRNAPLAATLRAIAAGGAQAFYNGPIAARLAAFVAEEGGTLSPEDFDSHTSTWVEPLQGSYLDHRIYAMPPNTQGIAQLAYAEMAKHHPINDLGHNTSSYLHTMIELKKLAFADRNAWVTDPAMVDIPVAELLDPAYLASRATLVDPTAAAFEVEAGIPGGDVHTGEGADDAGDTVYLTAVDAQGNAVSWIQSLFHGFGSGLLEPETGVLLHNRGSLYSLDATHPNVVAPGKRPYHTLSPLLATKMDGSFAFTLGTPGGDSQPQSLLQIMHNLLVFGLTPQAAIEAPRFRSNPGLDLQIEDRVPADVRAELTALGHQLRIVHGWTATFGGAQMILLEDSGTLVAAADPRREAYALAR